MADLTDTFYAGSAIHGYGGQLLVGDGGSPENFDAVAEVISITPPDTSTAPIDTTHMRSPGAHREKIPGMRDSGPFTVLMNWRPDHESQSKSGGGAGAFATGGLPAMAEARTNHNFKIVLNNGSPATEWEIRGYVSKFQPGEIGIDDKINCMAEIQPITNVTENLP